MIIMIIIVIILILILKLHFAQFKKMGEDSHTYIYTYACSEYQMYVLG